MSMIKSAAKKPIIPKIKPSRLNRCFFFSPRIPKIIATILAMRGNTVKPKIPVMRETVPQVPDFFTSFTSAKNKL